jgi:hypothetical protein
VILNKSTPAFAAATCACGHASVLDLAKVNPSHLRGVSARWHQRDLLLNVEKRHVGDGNPRRGEGSPGVLVLDSARQGRFAGHFLSLVAQKP